MENCKEIKKLVQILLEDSDKESLPVIEAHVELCEDCANYFNKAKSIRQLFSLHKPKEDAPPSAVKSQLHMKLVEKSMENRKKSSFFSSFFTLPSIVSVFSLAAVLVFASLYFTKIQNPQNSDAVLISKSEVDSGKPVTIKIEYFVAKELKNVEFDIELDGKLEFYSNYSEINSLKNHRWRGNLKKGLNEIPFVVKVKEDGRWNINTKASYDGYIHSHKIILNASEGKMEVSYYKLPPQKITTSSTI